MIYFQRELQTWRNSRAKINSNTEGIVRVIGRCLHRWMWLTPTQWGFTLVPGEADTKTLEARLNRFTEWYVVGVLIASVLIYYFVPGFWPALLSMYISASSLIVLLHIVLLQRALGGIASPERSILLFICNVAQIVFMFATWYHWGGEPKPLLTSVLTFATIAHAETMPGWAMAQIATDFVLLAIYLSQLIGQLGPKNGGK